MRVDVSTEVIINKAIDMVSDYASNPDYAPEWYINIKSAVWKTPKPLAVGSQVAFVAHFLGRKLAYTYEFIELIHRQKLVMRTTEGPFPMQTTYTWTAIDDKTTKMTLHNQGNPTGFSKIFAPLMAMKMEKANTQDLNNLKKILENT
ncbi:SRPBCC family protein [Cyclobacterium sp.]|uniref:SRPBCC family protein n=1 Tax=Cyclobacterium sp. TaxID=1966343 RepID=UPI0019B3422F|nr:SRPBCC family protein [Cyclobacterium sp.]MBD3631098.1 SRPBCC family protein [Cyclobacterium sp.]